MADRSFRRDDLPPIYVSKSGYDDMGAILDRLEIPYKPTSETDISSQTNAVVMINCKTRWLFNTLLPSYRRLSRQFRTFVEQGGSGIISDLAASTITGYTEAAFRSENWSDSVAATVEDEELRDLLGQRQVTLDLESAVNKPVSLPHESDVLLREANDEAPLAYSFDHEAGSVVYTAFHNHEQTTEVEDALFRLLLMIPIAKSTETTVTETYTTVVSDSGTDSASAREHDLQPEDLDTNDRPETVNIRLVPLAAGASGEFRTTISSGETIQVGRQDVQAFLPSNTAEYVSSQHCAIRLETRGDVMVTDLHSTNGTYVDGVKLEPEGSSRVERGQQIRLGDEGAEFRVAIE